ncbi:metallophosphoesterase [Hymenobacter weizhouensis]|uniref:metallophosphoesterase n=1 Tax=Hymenobacter sp. YIM 151500-1 TaxID=2987689 RepID=UPI0022269674|nr:metallophosphoesterase [Hymenobacter sp. YIM 151500-1]UYZ61551.1 metallophosphoesterase [Hymenobacter sp. YIM 151500-1]
MYRLFMTFLFVGLLVLAEWYGFQAVRTALTGASPVVRRVAGILYWLITVAVWALGIWAISTRRSDPATYKAYLGSLPLIFVAAKLVVLLFLLPEDLVRAGRWALARFTTPAASAATAGAGITRSEFLSRLALLAGAVPFVALIWGMFKGGTDYTVKRVTLRFPNLPPAFDGFKVLQISDLHTGSFQSREPLQRAVQLINQQAADLVFMTGDLVNDLATEVEPHIDTLAGIKSTYPIYSVLGNHDYADYVQWPSREAKEANLERLKQNHAKIGWELLLDEARTVERNGEKIAVLGVQNWGAQMRFPKYGNLAKAHAAADPAAPFKILLSHDPSHWDAQVQNYPDIDLMLAGHTHGMQFGVNLPFFKWSPVQYAYKQWAGLYEKGKQLLYVNAGLGYIGYPGRVGFLPEITVFELRRA